MRERNLCRGWTAANIKEAVATATDRQRSVLAQIATNPGTTTEEIAESLGWESYLNVRATLARFSQTTASIGVTDPRDGMPSWPFEIEAPARGSTFWRYYMPRDAGEVVLATLGQTS